MANNKCFLGYLGEFYAYLFLVKHNFTILYRNYRKPFGEIDIVATRFRIIHFIEVKSSMDNNKNVSRRTSYSLSDRIGFKKVVRIKHAGMSFIKEFMKTSGDDFEIQIDLVGVVFRNYTTSPFVEYIPHIDI